MDPEQQQAWFRSMWEGKQDQGEHLQPTKDEAEPDADGEEHEADEDGDDFDDFNEGGGEDDFGDFDEAEEAESTPTAEAPTHPPHPAAPPDILAGLVSSMPNSKRAYLPSRLLPPQTNHSFLY